MHISVQYFVYDADILLALQTSRRAVVVSTLSSALLLAAGAAGAKPARLADVVAEKAALNEQQLAIMEYALRQQETAVKAKAVSE